MNKTTAHHLISYGKLSDYGFMLLAFVLPFGKMFAGIAAALWLISIIITAVTCRKEQNSKAGKRIVLFAAYYLLHVAGMAWTENTGAGLFDLEVKLALLAFPVAIYFFPARLITLTLLRKTLTAMISGCFASAVVSMSFAFTNYLKDFDITLLYYTQSSLFMHTSYISMYIILAFSGSYFLFVAQKQKLHIALVVMQVFLLVYLNFLNSKAGLLSFAILLVLISLHILFCNRNLKTFFLYIIIPAALLAATVILIPFSTIRIEAAVQNVNQGKEENIISGESTADRLLIWDAAFDAGKCNFVSGTGTGDVKDKLVESYIKKGYRYPAEFKLNAHNQLIQSWVALGFSGFFMLLLMLAVPLVAAFRKKQFFYFSFIVVFGFNILVESMLEVQAGVLFYAFWNSALWLFMTRSEQENGKMFCSTCS